MVATKFRGKQHSEKARFEDLCEVLLTPLMFRRVEADDGHLDPRGADRVLRGHRHDLQRPQEDQDRDLHRGAEPQHAPRHPHRHPRHAAHGGRHRGTHPAHRSAAGVLIFFSFRIIFNATIIFRVWRRAPCSTSPSSRCWPGTSWPSTGCPGCWARWPCCWASA